MYEHYRNDIATALMQECPDIDVNKVLLLIDKISYSYDISEKTTLPATLPTIPVEVKRFIASKKIEGLSDKTIDRYARVLKMFFDRMGKSVTDVKTDDIRLYLYGYQEERKIDNSSLESYRSVICNFFEWCNDEGYTNGNVSKAVHKIKCEQKQKEALSRYELECVRDECKDDIRLSAMVEFMFSTGCRVSELCAVKKSDVDFLNGTVLLHGKGNKQRIDYINEKCKITLTKYLNGRNDECEYLFVSERKPHRPMTKEGVEKLYRDKFRNLTEKFGKPITPHIFRHTTATIGLQSGAKVEEIQKILGHSSISTTMRYAEVSDTSVKESHKRFVV